MAKNGYIYKEPADYFPKEIRKKAGLGEFAKKTGTKTQTGTKKNKK